MSDNSEINLLSQETKENERNYEDCEIISIEIIDGIKHIHYMGYGYYVGDEEEDEPYRFLEYTFLMVPLKEALNYVSEDEPEKCGIMAWECDNQEFVKQYIEDCTEERMNEIYLTYDDGNKPNEITIQEITMDTPCGTYIII